MPAEVLPMIDAVNGALDRLAVAYDIERRFTADAAHELRTPLAVLSLRLQQMEMSGVEDWAADPARPCGTSTASSASCSISRARKRPRDYAVAGELATG